MFKSSKTLLCVCLLLCMGHFVQALDLIEVMDLTVPVESALANIHITCTNSEKFVECECFYGNETHRLTRWLSILLKKQTKQNLSKRAEKCFLGLRSI